VRYLTINATVWIVASHAYSHKKGEVMEVTAVLGMNGIATFIMNKLCTPIAVSFSENKSTAL
jgi:hypothetical protein